MAASPAGAQPGLGLALWGVEPVRTLAANAALAEQAGFESAWIIDSQLLCREVYVSLAACLMRTTTLRVATGVTQPATRHLSVVASAAATLQEMAPGRVMLGFGTGFSSLKTIGKPAVRIDELERFTGALRRLLNGQGVTFDHGVEGSISWLRQPAGVPIHYAASRPRMTRSAGAHADGVILLQGTAPDLVARAIAWLDEGAETAGRPRGSVEISCWVPFSQDVDRRKALDRVRSRVAGALMQANPDWFEGGERDAIVALKKQYAVGDHAAASAAHAAIVPDSLVRKFAIAGDAQEVREQVRRLRANPRVSRIILNPQIPGPGALPIDQVIRDFGEAVLPHL
ncbi:LLM class flavin-dependent oxidoreductase [Rhodopila sp.]|jgi:5,10-methylenetetrahydromethanopterin reductase|uniref:LLM class flavin-dependent oxidoreductase n=1 Tax=Rhodopila sp. TaxID=2480087 RepID=UPI002B9EEA2E|nr:LLM class flavin-dependent oxidoreductase [Rhodopila sp.]HVZ07167.1 LLM class flavin-dependent oxidoreductase [Rhodopila sp.]